MKDYIKLFGERVKYYRKKSGLSQEKLSELCDLHPTYICQIE
ncbi:MAG: helix-turn-helix transcriptional regulator, partial [Oscillospiraceae bacterium]|nr:helix-turn-helix transcriptional regulator [Oscillospiraceae bacterium]